MATPNPDEAWKGVIDFAKTVLGIGSALLAAIASLLLVGNYKLEGFGWLPPGLLIISMLLCLYGFGGAIQALRSGNASHRALLCTNTSVVVLVVAIVTSPFLIHIDKGTGSIDNVLTHVETTTRQWHAELSAKNCRRVEQIGEDLLLTYEAGGQTTQVFYSSAAKQIVQIR
jgi:hypothetical protein